MGLIEEYHYWTTIETSVPSTIQQETSNDIKKNFSSVMLKTHIFK